MNDVTRSSGRWFKAVEKTSSYTLEQLQDPGREFEQYGAKIHAAALKSVSGILEQRLLRMETELWKKRTLRWRANSP